MSTKNDVLKLLQDNGVNFISGQQMAEELYVTRAAVWKAIKSLQKDGYPIEAVTNRGYRLVCEYSLPEASAITEYLKREWQNSYEEDIRIEIYDSVDSTNDRVRSFSEEKTAVVIAGSQTNGRGRRGRSFYSPEGSGIYMSILVHPDVPVNEATGLTCMMAVAICRAISKVLNLETQIKWVNDIIYQEKKVAGILTEAVTSIEDARLSYVIIGAGINLYAPRDGFPTDIRGIAGALLEGRAEEKLRDRLCAGIIGSFFQLYNNSDKKSYIEEYKNRSMLPGNYVKVVQYRNETEKNGNSYAYVEGIDDDCRLVVRYDDGSRECLSTGEVSAVKY